MSRLATVTIPSGWYSRGSGCSPDEGPVGLVWLSAYEIDIAPVTNSEFATFVQAGGYHCQPFWTAIGWDWVTDLGCVEPAYFQDPLWGEPDVPVTGVSWWEAAAYAAFRGGRLPTEAEWEQACAGPRACTYPWGEDEPNADLANFAPDGEPLDRRPTLVTTHPRNCSGYGLLDMAGNFSEWCIDNYAGRYGKEGTDPVVRTDERHDHVARGGSGLHDGDYLRCTARDTFPPTVRDNLISFRCAYTIDHE